MLLKPALDLVFCRNGPLSAVAMVVNAGRRALEAVRRTPGPAGLPP